ncbi:MAG: pirin family protein [Candidatus Micrarchaeia archaeon]
MFVLIPASGRHCEARAWLRTCFLFSFAEYFSPSNVQWGAIRVFNDDFIAPKGIFPLHPHAEYEIVTVVLEGEITHRDSMGNRQTVGAGGVQAMTAGTGITHSEANYGDAPLHSYQIWIKPRKWGLEPQYNQKEFQAGRWKGRLLAMASGQGKKGAAKINADATVYRCALSKGEKVTHASGKGRRLLLYVAEGKVNVNGRAVAREEQARIADEEKLLVQAEEKSEFVLIDAPA